MPVYEYMSASFDRRFEVRKNVSSNVELTFTGIWRQQKSHTGRQSRVNGGPTIARHGHEDDEPTFKFDLSLSKIYRFLDSLDPRIDHTGLRAGCPMG